MSDLVQLAILGAAFLIVFILIGRAMKQREARWESDDWRQSGRGTVTFGNALLEIHSMLFKDFLEGRVQRSSARGFQCIEISILNATDDPFNFHIIV